MLNKLKMFNLQHRKLLLLILTVSAIALTDFNNPGILSYCNFIILSISWIYEVYGHFISKYDID
jgi:hypothetical protein